MLGLGSGLPTHGWRGRAWAIGVDETVKQPNRSLAENVNDAQDMLDTCACAGFCAGRDRSACRGFVPCLFGGIHPSMTLGMLHL